MSFAPNRDGATVTKARETFLLNILDEIEQREARLLAWGIVDGYFSAAELIDLIDAQIDDALDDGFDDFLSANKVVDELLALQWIAPVELENGATAYRSRMAETVRLLSRLRQLFPKYAGDAGWQRAPTLVADFRFLRRQRRYPKRNRSVADALAVLRNVTSSTSLLQATRALLTPGGHALELAGFQVRAAERIVRGSKTMSRWRRSFAQGPAAAKRSHSIFQHSLRSPVICLLKASTSHGSKLSRCIRAWNCSRTNCGKYCGGRLPCGRTFRVDRKLRSASEPTLVTRRTRPRNAIGRALATIEFVPRSIA